MNTNNIIPMHQIGFPINLENIISDSDSVKVLYDVMEGLDYSELNRTYSTIGRNPALLPKTMFAIIVYGYMEVSIFFVIIIPPKLICFIIPKLPTVHTKKQ